MGNSNGFCNHLILRDGRDLKKIITWSKQSNQGILELSVCSGNVDTMIRLLNQSSIGSLEFRKFMCREFAAVAKILGDDVPNEPIVPERRPRKIGYWDDECEMEVEDEEPVIISNPNDTEDGPKADVHRVLRDLPNSRSDVDVAPPLVRPFEGLNLTMETYPDLMEQMKTTSPGDERLLESLEIMKTAVKRNQGLTGEPEKKP
jgi:hypothetical protein